MSIHLNSGQHCQANSRVFVHESVAEEFSKALVKLMTSRSIGDPSDKSVFQGPQGDRLQSERIVSILEKGKDDGTVLCGGKAADVNGKVSLLFFSFLLFFLPDSQFIHKQNLLTLYRFIGLFH
jgi:aldehyde dehydrogenase (NAD+)